MRHLSYLVVGNAWGMGDSELTAASASQLRAEASAGPLASRRSAFRGSGRECHDRGSRHVLHHTVLVAGCYSSALRGGFEPARETVMAAQANA